MRDLICIGVDQSYARTGISISRHGRLVVVSSVDLAGMDKHDARRLVCDRIISYASIVMRKGEPLMVLMERIRLFSQNFVSVPYILSMGAMNSAILDAIRDEEDWLGIPRGTVEVCTVDTRTWKRGVVGTDKERENEFGVPPKKWPAIEFLLERYPKAEEHILHASKTQRQTKKNFAKFDDDGSVHYYEYDNDAADSACISLFPWCRPDYADVLEIVE